MHSFKRDEITILLGAGASVEAGIPHSAEMIESVEKLINDTEEWAKFRDLYNYIRSSIYYSDGIRGKFDSSVNYNIERLVNTLEELSKKDQHTLYPFVGSWNPKLVEVAQEDFKLVGELRKEIIRILNKWIALEHFDAANYYRGLIEFQKEYQHPLRVFTLNYDLCVECACKDVNIERGFDKESRKWDWRQFEEIPDDPDIFLYKLHGSADWKRDEDGSLTYVDTPSSIDEAALIFGATYKLQYLDPFLFFAYQFRRWSLESRAIISIGYGYGDEHVNGMIRQALDADEQTLLLSVSPLFTDKSKEAIDENKEAARIAKKEQIAQALENKKPKQIVFHDSGTRKFMTKDLRLNQLVNLLDLPPEKELFATVNDQ